MEKQFECELADALNSSNIDKALNIIREIRKNHGKIEIQPIPKKLLEIKPKIENFVNYAKNDYNSINLQNTQFKVFNQALYSQLLNLGFHEGLCRKASYECEFLQQAIDYITSNN